MAEGFDSANGKFPNNLGNVALADCRSLGPKMADNFYGLAEELNKTQYFYLTPSIEAIGDQVNKTNFCEVAMTIEGVLTKSA